MKPDVIAPGEVLRAWRDYAGLTTLQAAVELKNISSRLSPEGEPAHASKGTIGNWETGYSSPSPEKVRQLAAALGLSPDEQDAMCGMWRAAGSASAVPRRSLWQHNYHPEPSRAGDVSAQNGPAWVWFRCPPSRSAVSVSVGWAPWGDSFTVPATRGGMLVSAPISLPNPPLQVNFSSPAWADFGNGVIPPEVAERLEIMTVDGVMLTRGRFSDPPELNEEELSGKIQQDLELQDVGLLDRVASSFKIRWQQLRPHLGAMRPNATVQLLEGARTVEADWEGTLQVDYQGALVSQLLLPLKQIRDIRKKGRGSSVELTASTANAKDLAEKEDHITGNQVENLERRGTIPAKKWVIARLDHVYQLDGHLGIERTHSFSGVRPTIDKDGFYVIRFPDFWIGPVWLQLHAAHAVSPPKSDGTLDLRWGWWRRLQQVRHNTIVSTRKAAADSEPLRAKIPPGWRITAGTGIVPGAIDINHDWYPTSWHATRMLIREAFTSLRNSGHLKDLPRS